MASGVNYEAEASVLGSVILEGDLFHGLEVEEAHFFYDNHRKIFRAMRELADQGASIDLVSITTNLSERIKQVGGTVYLVELAESVASTASIEHHQRLIMEAYQTRKTKEIALQYVQNPSGAKLEQTIAQLSSFRDIGSNEQEKTTFDHLVEISDSMCTSSPEVAGYPTCFYNLNSMTGGLQRGELIIVAARPSVGKTAFALNLAAGHCQNKGSTSIFSLEMGNKQLLQRMISAEAKIYSQKWKSFAFNERDYSRAIDTIGGLSKWKLYLHDNKYTVSDMRAALRKIVRADPDGKHIAIIDYLQLILPTTKQERRDLDVGQMTRELKLLAMELNIPIVLLSQLSRGVEQRQDKRPFMSDLRESGNIEQDADVIAFLYRDDYYRKDSEQPNRIEIILAKQRNGPTGTIDLLFQKEYGRFINLEGN
ncbi:replicative DNA helicase [Aquibacillus kalidii]|uniref:replicative DNA helicase n=1 Tax=Aquibacillus kalidii TaxID=2762597 RepID=UPI0016480BC9|nr:replicative DNA helicase [Aquibacillus kalidii]